MYAPPRSPSPRSAAPPRLGRAAPKRSLTSCRIIILIIIIIIIMIIILITMIMIVIIKLTCFPLLMLTNDKPQILNSKP